MALISQNAHWLTGNLTGCRVAWIIRLATTPNRDGLSPKEIINLDVGGLIIQGRSLGFLSLEDADWVTLFAFGNTMKNKNATNS